MTGAYCQVMSRNLFTGLRELIAFSCLYSLLTMISHSCSIWEHLMALAISKQIVFTISLSMIKKYKPNVVSRKTSQSQLTLVMILRALLTLFNGATVCMMTPIMENLATMLGADHGT